MFKERESIAINVRDRLTYPWSVHVWIKVLCEEHECALCCRSGVLSLLFSHVRAKRRVVLKKQIDMHDLA